ncbi:unnamed protein product [Brassica napus]|uniref:(rape) hypothetical protein n=1 Tax=Brassica napus TaxID=3708 RepID=A0A816SAR1_BRANA|nr:unnamed protein product [Brassica napus]
MVAAYTGSVAPVIDTDNIIELTAQLSELDMLPPLAGVPLAVHARNMKTPRRRTVCSRCKGCGHNRATCKIPIN